MTNHPFTYAELHTADGTRAKDFYRKLFGWKMDDQETPMGRYTSIAPGEGPGGGITHEREGGAPPHWRVYVRVADADKAVRHARELGGQTVVDVTAIPEGRFAVLCDPTGATFGLFEEKA